VLLVEDSRVCAEAVRFFCLRSGARLRRADSLRSAHRHLAVYRPSVVLVDLGLPDGSGLSLIEELAAAPSPTIPVIAISGEDPTICSLAAREAGAIGFFAKTNTASGPFSAGNFIGDWAGQCSTKDHQSCSGRKLRSAGHIGRFDVFEAAVGQSSR
jgi:CheY-like chemotaxis protein